MQDAHVKAQTNNIVEMSQFGQSRRNPASQGDRLLGESCEMAMARLTEALTESLQKSGEELLKKATEPMSFEMYKHYMQACDLVRERLEDISSAFRRKFQQQFKKTSASGKSGRSSLAELNITELSLMGPDDLEETLAANNIANAIHNQCGEEMFGLGHRIGLLLNNPEIESEDNPLGPEVIAKAIMAAIGEQDCGIKAKLLLAQSINHHLPTRVKEIYQEVNRFLREKGVLPTIRVGMKKTSPATRSPEGDGSPGAPQAPGNPDVFSMLQQLLGSGRPGLGGALPAGYAAGPQGGGTAGVSSGMPGMITGAVPTGVAGGITGGAQGGVAEMVGGGVVPGMVGGVAGGGVPGGIQPGIAGISAGGLAVASNGMSPQACGSGVPSLAGIAPELPTVPGQETVLDAVLVDAGAASPVVLQTLTRLQHGHIEGQEAQELDAAGLVSGRVNVLRQIRQSSVAVGMGHVDAMTLDIVALIFDYILDDHRVPDAMKALIGRLQIPVLKVAMLDKAFFSQKTHPARKLLDILAESSMGWNEDEGHESGLYRKVDELVQRILNEFGEEVDIFSTVLEEYEQYLQEEKARIDELTSRSAQVLYTLEQRELAAIVAQDTIHSHLFGRNVPVLIHDFLYGHWQKLLTRLYHQPGEGSDAWKAALETMADLTWSVGPKLTADERRQLVERLPGLLRRLGDGMQSIDTPAETRDRFFAELVKCHADAVKAGLKGAPAEPVILEDATAARPPAPLELLATEQPMDFEDIPVLTETVEIDPAIRQEIAAVPMSSQHGELEEITLSDVSWLAGGEPEGDRYDVLVTQLKRGTWIEFQQEDGSLARAKLAWISPMRGIYLFTNRLGQRAMSINAKGLAEQFREGRVQIIDNAPLVDRAVEALLSRLQNTA